MFAAGMVIFIDCGLIGELTQTQRFDLIDLMWSLQQSDIDSIPLANQDEWHKIVAIETF